MKLKPSVKHKVKPISTLQKTYHYSETKHFNLSLLNPHLQLSQNPIFWPPVETKNQKKKHDLIHQDWANGVNQKPLKIYPSSSSPHFNLSSTHPSLQICTWFQQHSVQGVCKAVFSRSNRSVFSSTFLLVRHPSHTVLKVQVLQDFNWQWAVFNLRPFPMQRWSIESWLLHLCEQAAHTHRQALWQAYSRKNAAFWLLHALWGCWLCPDFWDGNAV